MPLNESEIGKLSQHEASRLGANVYRNNNGKAWQGEPVRPKLEPVKLVVTPGDVLLRKARRINFGLGNGSGDYIGWMSRTITPDMVGKKIAQFVSFEDKTLRGVVEPDQLKWHAAVTFAGGLSGIVRDPAVDTKRILTQSF